MFSFLRGKINSFAESYIIIDTGSVGYKVSCPKSCLDYFQKAHEQELIVYTELLIREDGWFLYGFSDDNRRDWFKLLLTVQGVGAKVALSILSSLSVDDLASSILNNDKDKLCLADGVGGKLAVRLINELKDKALPQFNSLIMRSSNNQSSTGQSLSESELDIASDVISALINLGYKRNDVIAVVKELSGEQSFEDKLRQALKRLGSS